ncbi:hypothetical protein F8M41_004257 [Gigaspora margarita]|uniref:Uncharacterized protein n=2 Tax=Gigaspora margarita TaxID=4874 RepID=A0A8H3XBX7_GIGMA|nr:hypothetical protein F8M41_004257 [Gigaspora margarita]
MSSQRHDPFRYELEKYSRSYASTSATSNQWTHISRPNVFVSLENMFPAGVIVAGVGEPILKVIADQNTLLECLNVSYRHTNILKAKALLRSPTIGIRYNYSIVDRNGVTTAQEARKFQLRFKTIEDFESCAGIIGRYISCKPILGNDSNVSSSANANELGISNQTQVLSKVQTPFNNISIIPQQQITRSQREQSVTLTTRQESSQKSYSLDSSSRPSTSSSTSSFATTTDINSRPVQNQNNLSKIPTSTTFQRQIASDKYQETYDMISQKSTSQQHESNNQQRFNISQQQGISHEVITIDAIEQQRQPTSQRSCMDISFQTPVTQRSVPNISEQTNQSLYNSQVSSLPLRIEQRQTSPIQTTNNLEIHALNQRPSSNNINSSQKVVTVKAHDYSISFPSDDEELQAWIMNILKDPEYPQFVSRVEKLWKARLMM